MTDAKSPTTTADRPRKFTVVNERRSIHEFLFLVMRATCKLFHLLESTERLAATHPDLWATRPSTPTFGAASWMPVRLSYECKDEDQSAVMYGPDGLLAQLAYVGWVAEVDGVWERYRTSKQFGDMGNLSHGIEMTLMGEFRAIRNDLLKNGAVAQARTAHCKELRWFPTKGQKMHVRPHHVIDFLHRLGVWYGEDLFRLEGEELVRWSYQERRGGCSTDVISHRAEVKQQDGQWLLVLSVAFADGVCGCYAIETAATREELLERCDDLSAARPDPGAISPLDGDQATEQFVGSALRLPNGEMLPMLDLYFKAREDLKADKVYRLSSPPMQIRK